MLLKATVVSVVAVLASLASADSIVRVKNNCPFDLDIHSGGTSARNMQKSTIEYGQVFIRPIQSSAEERWKYIKVTKSPDGPDAPHLQLSYSLQLQSDILKYGINPVFGGGWRGVRVAVESLTCPAIVWSHGVPPAGGSGNKICRGGNASINLVLC